MSEASDPHFGQGCGSEEPYKDRILAGASLCGACGKQRAGVRYVREAIVEELIDAVRKIMQFGMADELNCGAKGLDEYESACVEEHKVIGKMGS